MQQWEYNYAKLWPRGLDLSINQIQLAFLIFWIGHHEHEKQLFEVLRGAPIMFERFSSVIESHDVVLAWHLCLHRFPQRRLHLDTIVPSFFRVMCVNNVLVGVIGIVIGFVTNSVMKSAIESLINNVRDSWLLACSTSTTWSNTNSVININYFLSSNHSALRVWRDTPD